MKKINNMMHGNKHSTLWQIWQTIDWSFSQVLQYFVLGAIYMLKIFLNQYSILL